MFLLEELKEGNLKGTKEVILSILGWGWVEPEKAICSYKIRKSSCLLTLKEIGMPTFYHCFPFL